MDTLPNAMLGEAIRMRDCSRGTPVPLRDMVVGLVAALCAMARTGRGERAGDLETHRPAKAGSSVHGALHRSLIRTGKLAADISVRLNAG